MGVFNGNGEFKSTVIGLALAIASGWGLVLDLLPWWAAVGGVVSGVYLVLPNRMRKLGDWASELGQTIWDTWKGNKEE